MVFVFGFKNILYFINNNYNRVRRLQLIRLYDIFIYLLYYNENVYKEGKN
jgi:hypothetical protein